MKYDIFISYSRKDYEIVHKIVSDLRVMKYNIWIDIDGIESSEQFKEVIVSAIENSSVILFFSSANSNASDWTAKEIGIANARKKPIIPFKIDNAMYNRSVEFDLINLDFIDYYSNKDIAITKLYKALHSKCTIHDYPKEDMHKNFFLSNEYDKIFSYHEDYAIVKRGNYYGCIDRNGTDILVCEYEFIGRFKNGRAKARKQGIKGEVDINGIWYPNTTLPISVAPILPKNNDKCQNFIKSTKKRSKILWPDCNEKGKYGFINSDTSEIIIPHIYANVGAFYDGLAWVGMQENHYGYINESGDEIIPQIYFSAGNFHYGVAWVAKKEENQLKYGFINKKGKHLTPFTYDSADNFDGTYARVTKNQKWGFIDNNGKEAIPIIFDEIGHWSDDMIKVRSNKMWGFFNRNSNEIITPKYEAAGNFSEGLANVELNHKYGYIDSCGDQVIPFIFDIAYPFNDGIAKVKSNGKWFFIDTTGKHIKDA